VVDLLRNVSLSPSKKVRASTDSWVPNNLWQNSQPQQQGNLLAPQAAPGSAEDVDLVALAPPVSTATVATGTEEKAIVLYKPVNPPLFPGGPPAGSSDPAFVVDTAGYLAACKGTGNNGSSSDAGHSSSAFASSSSDISWTGLFEALDLQGGKLPLPSRRLQRTSSCSSLPRFPASMDENAMEEETDTQPSSSSSQLALIPYTPPAFFVPSVDNTVQLSPPTTSDFPGADPIEDRIDEDDAMDVMEDSTPGGVGTTDPSSQFGSPIPMFGAGQWEPCEVFKAPYSKIMWSH